MPDDRHRRGPQDNSRINVNEDYELEYWSKGFGISKNKLKQAVAAVGMMAADVRKYLGK